MEKFIESELKRPQTKFLKYKLDLNEEQLSHS